MQSLDQQAVYCKDLTKVYHSEGEKTMALRGVDLEVKPGELMMLVGPSGSGKTTLISIAAGILNHDEGKCFLFGMDLRVMSEHERTLYRGKTVGFVFQAFNLIPTLTVAENVSIPLLIGGISEKEAMGRAEHVLERVGLEGKFRALPKNLSGGQQQRVAIARALVHEPKLIVCDEPTSALDHETGARVMTLLREVALKDNRTLIIVTHDNRIFKFADRVAMMDDGRITKIVTSTTDLK